MNYKKKFYNITNLIQQEFDRSLSLYGDKIQCRKGCSKCCSQIFRITPLDGWIISEHVKSLPDEERAKLVEKAKEYSVTLELTTPPQPSPKGRESIKKTEIDSGESLSPPGKDLERGLELPCPALGTEGECTIYDARPVICRRFGMPIYDYKNPGKVHACELNFSDGEEITDPQLIPNQTAIGMKWDVLKGEYNEFLSLNKDKSKNDSTTIAEAIVKAEK